MVLADGNVEDVELVVMTHELLRFGVSEKELSAFLAGR